MHIPGSCKIEKSGAFTDRSGEHTISHPRGVGIRKRECIYREPADEMVELMERINGTISPHNLFNVRLSKGVFYSFSPLLNHLFLSSCGCVRVRHPNLFGAVLTVVGDVSGSLICKDRTPRFIASPEWFEATISV